MVNATPIIVRNIDTGEEKSFRTLRMFCKYYGVSPNKLYRIMYNGGKTVLTTISGDEFNAQLEYKNPVTMVDVIRYEGSNNKRKRYKPQRWENRCSAQN